MPEYSSGGLNPVAVAFTACMAVLLLALPRRYAILPLFASACYMTAAQSMQVGGLNFSVLRILTLVGWIRLIARGEYRGIRWNAIDRAMFYWALAMVTTYTILWGTTSAFIYQCGRAYDAIGLYIFFRALIRNVDEATSLFKNLAVLIVPLAIAMAFEKTTGRNLFAVMGGVPEMTDARDGVLRCQGPFPHSILAGTFGAAMVPYFIGLWWQRGGKMLSVIGIGAASIIALTTGSSGPVMTYACGVLGWCLWPWRFRMQMVRRAIVCGLIGLQLVMKQPFWFVIAHMGVFSGSTAYYRAFLIDQTVRHFSEWWLVGTQYKQPWAPLLTDITDWYVRNAFDGGLLTLLLLFLVFKRCFAGVGWALRAEAHRSLAAQRTIWPLGAALFAHSMTLLAVWYWDQNIVNWYSLLAMIATVAAVGKVTTRASRQVSAVGESPTLEEPSSHVVIARGVLEAGV